MTAIRKKLDEDGFKNTAIMSYAVKFASAFYGPFRDAADSAPHFGDRKSYQMDYHNGREAMKEAMLDVEEGTDLLIVKPAMAFYDMLEKVVSATNIPVATYSVSGEYSMVKAAALNGWIDEERIIGEMAVGAYRSGAGSDVGVAAPGRAGQRQRAGGYLAVSDAGLPPRSAGDGI